MLTYILGAIAIAFIALIIFIFTRPDEFRVSRSQLITARPEQVFAEVNDLYKWNAWSPWAKIDPNAKMVFEGTSSGAGMKMSWDGNKEIGKGSMTITESRPSEFIGMTLDFIKPMKGTSNVEFTFVPQGDRQTLVTWRMHGKNNVMGKAVSLVFDCDKMVGSMYEQGLMSLKRIAESK